MGSNQKVRHSTARVFRMACVAVILCILAVSFLSGFFDRAHAGDNEYARGGHGTPYECKGGPDASIPFTKNVNHTAVWGRSVLGVEFSGKQVTVRHKSGSKVAIRGIVVRDNADGRAGTDLHGSDWTLRRGNSSRTFDASKFFAGSEGVTADNLAALTGTEIIEATLCLDQPIR